MEEKRKEESGVGDGCGTACNKLELDIIRNCVLA